MSTRSVVGYDNNGSIEGTYVHFDGYPENMLPELQERFEKEGYDNLVTWIEAGIAGGGYPTVESTEAYGDSVVYPMGDEGRQQIDAQEYGYLVTPEGASLVYSMYNEADSSRN